QTHYAPQRSQPQTQNQINMSCCNGNCGCGSDCKCGSGCNGCGKFADLGYSENTNTSVTIISGVPMKQFPEGATEMIAAEGGHGCKCGAK
ncbi:hypothetical protein HG533_12080, partial [Moraxella osloensis]|nr:hypothetical protein [Moraxella osloensis]